MSSIAVKVTRKELYEEILKLSVAGVARKYGIPYAKCMSQIKAAQIPVPPSGYWTKLNFGKQVEQPPLPGDGEMIVMLQKDDFQKSDTAEAIQTVSQQESIAVSYTHLCEGRSIRGIAPLATNKQLILFK